VTTPDWHASTGPGIVIFFIVFIASLLPLSKLHAQFGPTVFDSIRVGSIRFAGNSTYSNSEFLMLMETRKSPGAMAVWLHRTLGERFPGAHEARFFDVQVFENDLDLLRRHYKNNGFFEARVEGSFDIDDKAIATLNISIEEGRPSLIDSVAYRRLDDLPEDVLHLLSASPVLRPGRRYRAQDVKAERDRVFEIMANNGFPLAVVDSILVERKLSNNNVVVKYTFRHGRRLYFGEITENIKGVDELNLARQIIYDRIEFREGDMYSRARQFQGETNLNRLGVFSSVQITPSFPPMENETDSLVPILLELIPRQRFEVAPAMILNNQLRGLTSGAEIAFQMRNVFGGAQALTTRLNLLGRLPNMTGTYQASSLLRFDQPYLFSNLNSGYVTGTYSIVAEQDLAEGTILQLIVGAQRYFSDRMVGQVNWTYEISEFSGDAKALLGSGLINIDITETINFRNSIRGVSFEKDETDDLFNPARGFYYKTILEEAGLLEGAGLSPLPQANEAKGIRSTEYVKLEGIFKYFSDLSANRSTIFGTRFRLGSIFRYGQSKVDDLPVPPNRRYYAGGASSVRGWTVRELAADTAIAFFGSNALLEIGMEIRWRLFPTAKSFLDGFWFVAFADAGNLWSELSKISLAQTALAIGLGLRYNMFFGPIRVDFGLKAYNPSATGDKWFFQKNLWSDVVSKGVFQFGIGHAF